MEEKSRYELDLSIVIASFNCESFVERIALGFVEYLPQTDYQYELIFVDNNSSDSTIEKIDSLSKKYPFIKGLSEPKQGLSYARNKGIQEAKGQFIFILDGNKIPFKNLVNNIMKSFLVTPRPLAIGGRCTPSYDYKLPFWYDTSFENREWGNEKRFLTDKEAQGGFAGGCHGFQADIYKTFGKYNTELGMQGNKIRAGEETKLFHDVWSQNRDKGSSIFYYNPDIGIDIVVPIEKVGLGYKTRRSFGFGVSARGPASELRPLPFLLLSIPLALYEGVKHSIIKKNREKKLSTAMVKSYLQIVWYLGYFQAKKSPK